MGKVLAFKTLKVPRSHWQLEDFKFTGDAPVWNADHCQHMDDEVFDSAVRKSMNYYNYYFNSKDLKKYVTEFMHVCGKYKEAQIKQFDKVADKDVPITLCSLVVAHKTGMPLREKYEKYIYDSINSLISGEAAEPSNLKPEAKPAAVVVSIQDRMAEKTNELMGQIEAELDLVLTNKVSTFKPFDFLQTNNVPQSQLIRYELVFGDIMQEFKQAQHGGDEQLKEAYSYLKSSDYKRILNFLQGVLDAVQQYKVVKKATKKARAKKPINKQKLVSRIKYCKEHKELKLVSINPADILDASELWVYNTKTRKLGKYVAEDFATLSVKGTSIVNFNENKSVSKTLRKPEEKLKEFAKAGKVQLRKFLDSVRSVETKLNGRINADIVLLRTV
jgi:hypothetical protein